MNAQEPTGISSGNELFPVFLKLNELQVLLVGAGNIGLEKLIAITGNSPAAQITVVAEKISGGVREIAGQFAGITLSEKSFEAADLDEADIVFVATNNEQLNAEIKKEARKRKLLVNFADKPGLCDFYLGSVVQKGSLKLGISTNGKSPTLAKRLKQVLDEALPSDLEEALDNLNKIRDMLQGDFTYKVKKLNQITELLITDEKQKGTSQ